MIPDDLSALIGAVLVLAVVYCLGGLHGIWLAFTEEVRFKAWAVKVADLHDQLLELETKGKNS